MSGDDLEHVLRAFASRRPFRPFTIELHSGAQLLVRHPKVVIRRDDRFGFATPDRRLCVFDGAAVGHIFDPPVG
jgi:hypothetical protein